MKILCTGDVHIGRRSSRLPSDIDSRSLSCAAAWDRIVDLAVSEEVDLLAVSGDLVDRANRFYEAAGPVERGLRELARAGIPTVMVAGNHDFDVLPRLVEGLGPEVRLLGRNGSWERFTLERNGEVLHVDGWSFPEGRVQCSPLAAYPFSSDGAPVLGLLHADLDQPASPYAPVSLAELRAQPVALWLLGHVHAPSLREEAGSATVLYPGSPQAMDPGETGAHGAWIAETGPAGRMRLRGVPVSSVRYDEVEVDVDGTDEEAELHGRVVDGVRGHLRGVAEEAHCLRYLSCRVRVVGRTALHRGLEQRLAALCADLDLPYGEIHALVERVVARTAPARDLEALAGGKDGPAVLARLVHALGNGGPEAEHEPLLRHASHLVHGIRRAKPYLALVKEDEPEIDLTPALREQAVLLLDQLLAQKEVDA